MSVDPLAEKFNIVSNDYWRTHKCDFSVFEKKNQNCQCKLKFGTKTNSSMHNSGVMFTFSFSGWKHSFWVNLVQKIKTVSLRWNSVPRLIRICRIQWCCPLFRFRPEKLCFFGKFSPKNQNCQFKLKLGTYTNSNMQNSMVLFTFSVLHGKYPFW